MFSYAYRSVIENRSIGLLVINFKEIATFTFLRFVVSRFMGYHTILKTSADFIDALKNARDLAKKMSTKTESDVFAYR